MEPMLVRKRVEASTRNGIGFGARRDLGLQVRMLLPSQAYAGCGLVVDEAGFGAGSVTDDGEMGRVVGRGGTRAGDGTR